MRKTDANVQAVKRTMTEARTGLERRAGTKVAEKKFFRMRAKENLALEASDLLGEVLTQQSTSHLQQIYPINSTSPTYMIVPSSNCEDWQILDRQVAKSVNLHNWMTVTAFCQRIPV